MVCEACRHRAVVLREQLNESMIPYCLCQPCYERLLHRSLRPLEYFNLVALHGHEYDLHDDFYTDEGMACAASKPVEPDTTLTFPPVESLRGHVERLVDYALVKWWYPAAVTPYLAQFTTLQILRALDDKLAYNPFLLLRMTDMAGKLLVCKSVRLGARVKQITNRCVTCAEDCSLSLYEAAKPLKPLGWSLLNKLFFMEGQACQTA